MRSTTFAWQALWGARHNTSFCEPEGRAAVAPPSEAQRNDWGNFAECGVMLNANGIYPAMAVPLRCTSQTNGEARTQARNERALLFSLINLALIHRSPSSFASSSKAAKRRSTVFSPPSPSSISSPPTI